MRLLRLLPRRVVHPTKAAVYGYEPGSSMAGGTDAAGRRVNLPFQTSDLGSLTAEGGALLVAAVDWVSWLLHH